MFAAENGYDMTAKRASYSPLVGRGAQAIILGCTEIMLLIS